MRSGPELRVAYLTDGASGNLAPMLGHRLLPMGSQIATRETDCCHNWPSPRDVTTEDPRIAMVLREYILQVTRRKHSCEKR